jgi:hypothetical protein
VYLNGLCFFGHVHELGACIDGETVIAMACAVCVSRKKGGRISATRDTTVARLV